MKKESQIQIKNIHMLSKDKEIKKKCKPKKCSFMSKPQIHYNSFYNSNNINTLMTTTTTINVNTNANTNTNNTNINTNEINYEILLNKLLKHCKKVLNEAQYSDIKKYITQEISNNKSSRILHKNESISSILKEKSTSNTTLTLERASSPCNYSSNQMHSLNYSNDFKGNQHSYKQSNKNEKKFKLSYDFSNLIASPKPKPIKIHNNNIKKIQYPNNNKVNTTPIIINKNKHNPYTSTETLSTSSKAKTFINMSNNNKDSHSLYTIIKSSGYSRRKPPSSNTNKQNNSNHSNSQSRSNSFSRDCSLNNLNCKVNTYNMTTQTISGTNGLNGNYYSNTNTINNECNSSQSRNSAKKVKQTLITKSHPFLNEKLFTKLNLNIKSHKIKHNKMISNKTNKHICKRNPSEHHHRNSFKKTNNTTSKISNSAKRTSKIVIDKDLNILYCNSTHENELQNNKNNNKFNKKGDYIKTSQQIVINNENKQIKENTEMMKQIKNTLDDNLKVIFNFSYEDFLSKESETESKKSSRLETLMY